MRKIGVVGLFVSLGVISAAATTITPAHAAPQAGGFESGYLSCPSQYVVAATARGIGHVKASAAGYSNMGFSDMDEITVYVTSVSRTGSWRTEADLAYNGNISHGYCEHV
jgi:hypothetical protein